MLLTLSAAQLLMVLDQTIVNTAIPRAQADLGIDDASRQWIVTAYALTFGAVLLIGGRVADYWGRKRTFILGLALFAAASLWGGLASDGITLIAARALQGAAAALMSPAALSLVNISFPSGRARTIAFALLGGVVSSGAAVGLILGGFLTDVVSWRWCLLINVPVVAVALAVAWPVLRESKAEGEAKYDVLGALTILLGIASLVFGLTKAEAGWISGGALWFVAGGLVLIVLFVLIQHRSRAPLLPLRIVTDRTRAGSLLVLICSGSVMAAISLYITLHLQGTLGMSPLLSGVATLPLAVAIALTIPVLVRVIPRTGPKLLMVAGPIVAAAGVFLLSFVSVGGSYWLQVLPGLTIMGVGMAAIFVPSQNLAMFGVTEHDAGAAAAASQAANQIGGSVGLAILTNVFLAAAGHGAQLEAQVAGYSAVFLGSTILLVVAALISAFVIRLSKTSAAEIVGGAPSEQTTVLH